MGDYVEPGVIFLVVVALWFGSWVRGIVFGRLLT